MKKSLLATVAAVALIASAGVASAEGTGQRFVAFDVLGSGVGERVLVVQGSVAAAWFPGEPPPVDALIIGSIDPPGSTS